MRHISNYNLYLVAFFLIITANLYSEPIDLKTAIDVVNGKIISLNRYETFALQPDAIEIKNENIILGYLFRLEPSGYMVVAADDDLPPVIAYSFMNDFAETGGNKNSFLELLMADLSFRMNNIRNIDSVTIHKRKSDWLILRKAEFNQKTAQLFQQWPPEGTTSTGGWLETNWTQTSPYNNFCPMDPVTNQRSVAGCPATAMAQILNYYQTVNGTYFSNEDDYHHSYSGRNYWIDDDCIPIDFPCFPDLNAYLDTITMSFENNSTLKNNEKAALTFACGVAAHQVYTSQVSGTFGVDQAEEAYIRFGFAEALLVENTDTSLFTKLRLNMMEARPAHLAVVDPGWTMGHNVVADGYNTDNYYHLNFGWGGSYNGWYLLPEEIPYGLTVIEGLIVNISYPQASTGVNQKQEEALVAWNISPNPVSTDLNIKFLLDQETQVKFDIYNSNGQVLITIPSRLMDKGEHSEFIELGDSSDRISRGLYICRFQAGNKIFHQKFIVP